MFETESIPTAPFAPVVEPVLGVADALEVSKPTLGVTVFGVGVDNKGDPEVSDGAEGVGVPSALEVATEGPEPEGAAEEDPSTKEPVPHGIFSPFGWIDWEGATMILAESVIAKRPVQVLFAVDGDVN